MALRKNTIEYAFETRTTSLSAATRHDFSVVTVEIAESTSRTFRSVYVEIDDRGAETGATSMTSWLIGIKIDAVAFSDTTVTSTLVNSGDQQSHTFRSGNLASYFTTNYTGTSHSVQVGVQFGALATINIAARLKITYEYSDVDDTRTKTARIPIESGTSTLTAALAEIGSYQIPALTPNWQSFTVDHTTDTFTAVGHGYQNGMEVVFRNSGGALPLNLVARPSHYHIINRAADTFQVSTTLGGGAFNVGDAGSGTNEVSARFFLPEASVSIKDKFIEVFANEGHVSGTTDDQLGVQIDSDAEVLFGSLEQALDSSPWMRVVWKPTFSNTLPHQFKARGTTTGRLPQLAAYLVVTYTYDESDTTRVLQSIELIPETEGGAMGGTSSGNQSKVSFTFPVVEPGTIELMQSAACLYYSSINSAITGLNVAVGSQTHRAYTPATALNSPAGQHTLVHRFDNSGAAGAGITLARGENELLIAWYRTSSASAAVGGSVTWRAVLNYISDKASAGTAAHNHTVSEVIGATAAVGTTRVQDYSSFAPNVPESTYWVTSLGYELDVMHAGKGGVTHSAERQSGEGVGDGWAEIHTHVYDVNNELSTYQHWHGATDMFDRHPGELDTERLAVETSRAYRVATFIDPATVHAGWTSMAMIMTYHSITFTDSGSVTGYTGDGSGLTVRVHRDDTGEELYHVTTATGGTYTVTGYDDTIDMFAEVEEDSTHVGRSAVFNLS